MGHHPGLETTATVAIFDDDGPGMDGPWRLCRPCAAVRARDGERQGERREIGLSFETDSRCEDCGVRNAAPAGTPRAEAYRGPDSLYYLLRGDYAGVPPGVVLEAMSKNVPVPTDGRALSPARTDRERSDS